METEKQEEEIIALARLQMENQRRRMVLELARIGLLKEELAAHVVNAVALLVKAAPQSAIAWLAGAIWLLLLAWALDLPTAIVLAVDRGHYGTAGGLALFAMADMLLLVCAVVIVALFLRVARRLDAAGKRLDAASQRDRVRGDALHAADNRIVALEAIDDASDDNINRPNEHPEDAGKNGETDKKQQQEDKRV